MFCLFSLQIGGPIQVTLAKTLIQQVCGLLESTPAIAWRSSGLQSLTFDMKMSAIHCY